MIIYANPSTSPRPKKRAKTATKAKRKRSAAPKGAKPMATHRTAAQKRATARLIAFNRSRKKHHNPSHAPRKAKKRHSSFRTYSPSHFRRGRKTHRNPSIIGAGRGILGDLASKDGLMLLGGAAVAPMAVNAIADYIVPAQYNVGWTGLLARAAITGGLVYVTDRFLKQRKLALGIAVGSGGNLLLQAYKTWQVGQVIPVTTPAQQGLADEIAKNPTLYQNLMNADPYASLNGYAATPMGGYAATPMGEDPYASLN